jgi:Mitochondrial biogenesis AIM24
LLKGAWPISWSIQLRVLKNVPGSLVSVPLISLTNRLETGCSHIQDSTILQGSPSPLLSRPNHMQATAWRCPSQVVWRHHVFFIFFFSNFSACAVLRARRSQLSIEKLRTLSSHAGSASQPGPEFDPTGKYKIMSQGAWTAVEVAISENGQDGLKSEAGTVHRRPTLSRGTQRMKNVLMLDEISSVYFQVEQVPLLLISRCTGTLVLFSTGAWHSRKLLPPTYLDTGHDSVHLLTATNIEDFLAEGILVLGTTREQPGDCQELGAPTCRAGAMVSMSNNVEFSVKLEGGAGAALGRCCCTGESAFFSYYRYTAPLSTLFVHVSLHARIGKDEAYTKGARTHAHTDKASTSPLSS